MKILTLKFDDKKIMLYDNFELDIFQYVVYHQFYLKWKDENIYYHPSTYGTAMNQVGRYTYTIRNVYIQLPTYELNKW